MWATGVPIKRRSLDTDTHPGEATWIDTGKKATWLDGTHLRTKEGQEVATNTRSWKRLGRVVFQSHERKHGPADTSLSDFQPPDGETQCWETNAHVSTISVEDHNLFSKSQPLLCLPQQPSLREARRQVNFPAASTITKDHLWASSWSISWELVSNANTPTPDLLKSETEQHPRRPCFENLCSTACAITSHFAPES